MRTWAQVCGRSWTDLYIWSYVWAIGPGTWCPTIMGLEHSLIGHNSKRPVWYIMLCISLATGDAFLSRTMPVVSCIITTLDNLNHSHSHMLGLFVQYLERGGPKFAGMCRTMSSLQVRIEALQQGTRTPVNDFSRLSHDEQDSTMAQVALIAPEDKPVRLWLMPCADTASAERQGSQDSAQFSRRIAIVRADSPILRDVDLALNIDTDLHFPIDSFIGSGAFGEVSSAFVFQIVYTLYVTCIWVCKWLLGLLAELYLSMNVAYYICSMSNDKNYIRN